MMNVEAETAVAAAPPPTPGLRGKIFQGGALMMGRQLVTMGLSLISLLMITRIIGPAAYGPYVAAFSICLYAQNLGQAGIGVYLVRAAAEVDERTWNVAATLLLVIALLLVTLLEASLGLIEAWSPLPDLGPLLSVLLLSLIPQILGVAASARLERALDFRRVAMIELVGQLIYYCVALPLVWFGYSVWSLVAAWLLQQVFCCIAFYAAASFRPRLQWDAEIVRGMLRYTFSFAAADWSWQLRGLVNPFIVGHFLPAEAVGQVGLAIRLMELLSFTKTIAWRLSVAALAKIQTEPRKLIAATTDGMRLQTLALGPVLIGFSWFGGYALSLVFGPRWEPVMVVYPFLALSYLTNAQFNFHSSVLYVLRRNWDVSWFHIVHISLFAGAAWICVGRWGIVGYGYGEMAALLSYIVIHRSVQKAVGSPDYGISALWWASLAIGLFWRDLGPGAIAAPILGLLCPPSIRMLKVYYHMFAGAPRHAV
nr:oligosaccharide flippase family protein [uncultured Rhodopila sp.]